MKIDLLATVIFFCGYSLGNAIAEAIFGHYRYVILFCFGICASLGWGWLKQRINKPKGDNYV